MFCPVNAIQNRHRKSAAPPGTKDQTGCVRSGTEATKGLSPPTLRAKYRACYKAVMYCKVLPLLPDLLLWEREMPPRAARNDFGNKK